MEENNFRFLQIKHYERKNPSTYFRKRKKKEILPILLTPKYIKWIFCLISFSLVMSERLCEFPNIAHSIQVVF